VRSQCRSFPPFFGFSNHLICGTSEAVAHQQTLGGRDEPHFALGCLPLATTTSAVNWYPTFEAMVTISGFVFELSPSALRKWRCIASGSLFDKRVSPHGLQQFLFGDQTVGGFE